MQSKAERGGAKGKRSEALLSGIEMRQFTVNILHLHYEVTFAIFHLKSVA